MFKSHKFSKCWESILVDREFVHEGVHYRYSVGQPMGAYSSWAAFTLAHHLVVHYAAFKCGIRDFKAYIILGDDIVINHDKVAEKYIGFMMRMGVDISLAKTHVSYNTYEFAKRWIRRGIEISGVPLKGILGNLAFPHVILQLLYVYKSRIPAIKFNGSVLQLVCLLYDNLHIRKAHWTYRRMYNYCKDFYLAQRFSFGHLSDFELRKYLLSKVPEETCMPSEQLVQHFMLGLLTITLDFKSEKLARDVSKIFKDYIQPYKAFEGFEIPKLKSQPLLHALYEKLLKSRKAIQTCYKSSDHFDLIQNIQDMRIESVDKIREQFRDVAIRVKGLDRL